MNIYDHQIVKTIKQDIAINFSWLSLYTTQLKQK